MSKIAKSSWGVSGEQVRLTVPFAKVDEEHRLVSGFATLDNIDSQGDVVTADASRDAFARARGNIREMHQPIAAGRLVDFREDDFFYTDPETGVGKFYRGIFVTAYVSRGAESTWQKVLDGTLTGFSIGGEIRKSESQYVPDLDKTIRFVKEYDLIELSLVDNPANQLANVFSIQKSAEGSVTLKGMVAETSVENVFWCDVDNIARTADADAATCSICGSAMATIGWIESGAEKTEKVREVISEYLENKAAKDASEGGVTMEKSETTNSEVPGVDEAETEATAEAVDTSEETEAVSGAEGADATEEVEPVEEESERKPVPGIDEIPDESAELHKKMEDLMTSIDESLTKTREEATAAVSALEDKVTELTKSIETKFSEFENKITELDKNLAVAKSSLATFEKNLEKYNDSAAFKKSGEVERTEPEKVQKDDDWAGAFSVKSLFR